VYSVRTQSTPSPVPSTASSSTAPVFNKRVQPRAPLPSPRVSAAKLNSRAELYHLPPPNSREWTFVARQPSPDRAIIRVLPSASVPGFLITRLDYTGEQRVIAWEYLPDLLYWNPFLYFRDHPLHTSVWIENVDDQAPVQYVNEPADPPLALVLTRAECTYDACAYIRAYQRAFFDAWDLVLPPASEFVGTLRGR